MAERPHAIPYSDCVTGSRIEFGNGIAYHAFDGRAMPPGVRRIVEGTGTNQQATIAKFDLDGMLGGLAKWLRIVGFDAAFPRFKPRGGRWFVTAVKSKGGLLTVWVSSSRPLDQLKEVLGQSDLRLDPGLFFTRCVLCNEPVVEVPKEDVAGEVPQQIFDTVSCFHRCPACGRVYWEGSHLKRTKERLSAAGIPLD